MVGIINRTEFIPVIDFTSGINNGAVIAPVIMVVVSVMRNPAALATKARVPSSNSSHLVSISGTVSHVVG